MNNAQIKTVVVGIVTAVLVLIWMPSHARYEWTRDGKTGVFEITVSPAVQTGVVLVAFVITALIVSGFREKGKED